MDGVVATAARSARRARERYATWQRTGFDPMRDDTSSQLAFLSGEARRLQRRVKVEREPATP